jgi:two-component system, NtrC family, nitrogen regulation response regulator GlnG
MHNRILLVEDDAATRSGLFMLLARAGYDVVATGSVPEGRLVLDHAPPDLLITDVRLGAFNGLQLLARSLAGPIIPAIVTTGFPDAVLEAQARRFGASFLRKPIEPMGFLTLVKKLLREGS